MTMEILNDRWHTAVHEAGHAVVSRVLGLASGGVSIVPDHDSAGHAICADPYVTLAQWERSDRYREIATAMRGRIIALMAGAEAEIALLGFCEGGDVNDRREIAMMIDSTFDLDDDGMARLESRLRKMTAAIVRRHVGKIAALARRLMDHDTIAADDEIRKAAGLPPPLPPGPIWLAFNESGTTGA